MDKIKQWFSRFDWSFLNTQSTALRIGIGALALFLLGALFCVWSLSPMDSANPKEKPFIVKNGDSAYDVADFLANEGLIRHPKVFRLYYRVFHKQNELQSGNYKLNTGMSASAIASDIANGRGKSYVSITIPEGYTVDRIAALFEEKGLGKAEDFKKAAKAAKNPFIKGEISPDSTYPVEGYLFPDTYHLYLERPAEEELIAAQLANFERKTAEMRKELEGSDMTLEQWVTLASLVEREVRKQDEQAKVAGIFWKRLHIDMPLQSCATIQYILGEPKLELTIADTQIASPYNTYIHSGFPPGPVSNPGLPALKASLHPQDTNELFFVARSDGSHIFSSTYEEHLRAIELAN